MSKGQYNFSIVVLLAIILFLLWYVAIDKYVPHISNPHPMSIAPGDIRLRIYGIKRDSLATERVNYRLNELVAFSLNRYPNYEVVLDSLHIAVIMDGDTLGFRPGAREKEGK